MQILLANAKIMFKQAQVNHAPWTEPQFQETANLLAANMSTLSIEELAKQLDCSYALASENWRRYQDFFSAEKYPALLAYNGQAYKHLRANTLSEEMLRFGQNHLWITCFLYGLLRPMDSIVPYRMEHCVRLEATHDAPVNQYWKDLLTDVLIDSVKKDDGVLIHLSTEEYEHLFDWKRVCEEVRVIQPLFYVRKNGQLKMQAVWAKSCRGAMVRFILQNQITRQQDLYAFSHEGFEYDPKLGEEQFPHFIRED